MADDRTDIDRRTFTKKAGLGIAASATPGVLAQSAAASHDSWDDLAEYTKPDAPEGYDDMSAYLSSALEHVEQKEQDLHEFRLAGEYASVGELSNPSEFRNDDCVKVDGSTVLLPMNIARVEAMSIENHKMKIVNESTDSLSVWTSNNQNEVFASPGAQNDDGPAEFVDEISFTSGALGLAASGLSYPTAGLSLGAASVLSAAYSLGTDGEDGEGEYTWDITPDYGLPCNELGVPIEGAHHCDFYVEETGSGGSIKVQSQAEVGIVKMRNMWRVHFDDGIDRVEKLDEWSDGGGGGGSGWL